MCAMRANVNSLLAESLTMKGMLFLVVVFTLFCEWGRAEAVDKNGVVLTNPSVEILAPLSDMNVTNWVESLTFSGSATAPGFPSASVQWRLNGGNWQGAEGFPFWSISALPLELGENLVEVRVYASSGGMLPAFTTSEIVQRRIYRLSHDQPGFVIMLPGNVPMEFVAIPENSFVMGSEGRGSTNRETPLTNVTFSNPNYISRTEVTQEQWQAIMGNLPRDLTLEAGIGPKYPVYSVSWHDAVNYAAALSNHVLDVGEIFVRLPTEAEWEHACRAGTTTRFYFGDSLDCPDGAQDCAAGSLPGNRSDYMWYVGNSGGSNQPVGQKLPNQWGLRDMHGSVWEWCQDYYAVNLPGGTVVDPFVAESDIDGRPMRGGGWISEATLCRSSNRNNGPIPATRLTYLGFRLSASHYEVHMWFYMGIPTSTTPNSITWRWIPNLDWRGAYSIFTTEGETPALVNPQLVHDATEWTQTGLTPNTLYSARGQIQSGLSDSNPSPVVRVYTLANVPTAPTCVSSGQNAITVSISTDDGNPVHTQYALRNLTNNKWYDSSGNQQDTSIAAYAPSTAWQDVHIDGLDSGTTYRFAFRARNGDNIETAIGAVAEVRTDGQSTTVGSIQVVLVPEEVRGLGAMWRLLGSENWYPSGYMLDPVPAGLETVEFFPIMGWDEPGNQVIAINAVELSVATGTYTRIVEERVTDRFPGQLITGTSGSISGSTIDGIREQGEPNHAGVSSGPSAWYTWQAPTSRQYTFSTCLEADFDTVIAVYRGDTIGELQSVVSNDDHCQYQSRVYFEAVTDATYRIAVAGYSENFGNFILDWNPVLPRVEWSPENPVAGEEITVLYNANGGPLDGAGLVKLHFGFNGWNTSFQSVQTLPMSLMSDHRWGITIPLPLTATELNFVFADGDEQLWDNNGDQDWRVALQPAVIQAPTVTIENPQSPTRERLLNDIMVLFSESVTGLVAGDFETNGIEVMALRGSGSAYELDLALLGDAGIKTIQLPADAAHDSNGTGNLPSNVVSIELTVDEPDPAIPLRLMPPDSQDGDYFGRVVHLQESRLFVGAPRHKVNEAHVGTVYIYQHNGSEWVMEQKLLPNPIPDNPFFGDSISAHGNRLAIGAQLERTPAREAGAVYLFEHDGTQWNQVRRLQGSDIGFESRFGCDVDLHGNRLLVGALGRNTGGTGSNFWSGRAYLYDYNESSGNWAETILHNPAAMADDYFATTARMMGDTLLFCSNHGPSHVNPRNGEAWIFQWSETESRWAPNKELLPTPPLVHLDSFGYRGTLVDNGREAIIGAPRYQADGDNEGRVFVYRQSGNDWQQVAVLAHPDAQIGDRFGASLAANERYLLVSATGVEVDGVAGTGAAYLYERMGNHWEFLRKLTPPDPSIGLAFGREYKTTAINDTWSVVGALGTATTPGSVFVYANNLESEPLPTVEWDPEAPYAGGEVTITYRTEGRPLFGHTTVRIHHGFNGWSDQFHPVETVEMLPISATEFYFTVQIPPLADEVNFVFTDQYGVIWDNNNQLDWSISVTPPPTGVFVAIQSLQSPTHFAFLPGVTVTFSAEVSGLTLSDFSTQGIIVENLQGSGASYTIDLTLVGEPGQKTIQLPANAVTGPGGVPNEASNVVSIQYLGPDVTPPTVFLQEMPAPADQTFFKSLSVTFSEPITGLAIEDFLLEGIVIVALEGSGMNYTLDVQLTVQPGGKTIHLPAGVVADLHGNPNLASNTVRTWLSRPNLVYLPLEWRASAPMVNCEGPTDGTFPWHDPSFDDNEWTPLLLPDMNTIPVNHDRFYRTTFNAVDGLRHQFVFNSDDGIRVFLNGQLMIAETNGCYQQGCVNPILFCGEWVTVPPVDMTPLLAPGENFLAVHVSNGLLDSYFWAELGVGQGSEDSTTPTVVLQQPPSPTNQTFIPAIEFTYSEQVTAPRLSDFHAPGLTLSSLQWNGINAGTIDITLPPVPGSYTLQLLAGAVADMSGNPSGASNIVSVVYTTDPIAPPSVQIGPLPTLTDMRTFLAIPVRFSAQVIGLELGDFVAEGIDLSNLQGSGMSYTIDVTLTGDPGVKSLQLPANAAQDGSGQGNLASNIVLVTLVECLSLYPDGIIDHLLGRATTAPVHDLGGDGVIDAADITRATRDSRATIEIDVTPDNGGWSLAGPASFDTLDAVGDRMGDDALHCLPTGNYTLSFADNIPGMIAPDALHADLRPGDTHRFVAAWVEPPPPSSSLFPGITIHGESGSIEGTTNGAVREEGEPAHAGALSPSAWYSWTTPITGTATVSTCLGATFDTVLAVYTGDTLATLVLHDDDDDTCGLQSRVTFPAIAGTTYRIAIAAYEETITGNFTLDWNLEPAEPITAPDPPSPFPPPMSPKTPSPPTGNPPHAPLATMSIYPPTPPSQPMKSLMQQAVSPSPSPTSPPPPPITTASVAPT
jgi:formylglycine-generating enzyme required for sulfatase activity